MLLTIRINKFVSIRLLLCLSYGIVKKERHLRVQVSLLRIVSRSISGCSQAWWLCPKRTPPNLWWDRLGILFSLVSLTYFSIVSTVNALTAQRNQQHPKWYQQCQYPQNYHNDFIICHLRHLPSAASPVCLRRFRLCLQLQPGRMPPCHRALPYLRFYHTFLRVTTLFGKFPHFLPL